MLQRSPAAYFRKLLVAITPVKRAASCELRRQPRRANEPPASGRAFSHGSRRCAAKWSKAARSRAWRSPWQSARGPRIHGKRGLRHRRQLAGLRSLERHLVVSVFARHCPNQSRCFVAVLVGRQIVGDAPSQHVSRCAGRYRCKKRIDVTRDRHDHDRVRWRWMGFQGDFPLSTLLSGVACMGRNRLDTDRHVRGDSSLDAS